MGETGRLPYGDGAREALRAELAVPRLYADDSVSSSPSNPEIRRLVRGRRVEAVALAELIRTLLVDIAVSAVCSAWACSLLAGSGA